MKLTRLEKLLIILEFAGDLAANFYKKFSPQMLRALSCLLITSFTLFTIFLYKPNAQSVLPSCSSLPMSTTPNPGVNCTYFAGFPLCRDLVGIAPQHRVNCADLIDLPLCSDIVVSGGVTANPGRNCVELCSNSAYINPDPDASPALIQGVDFAVFNKDCTRFCDDVESGIVANPGVNCVSRKCHQLPANTTPITTGAGQNCNILPCNLLTPDELNKPKFDDNTKKYCEGNNLKCYNFTTAQLPYMRLRAQNPTCILHSCVPSSPICGANDVLNVTNKGSTYTSVYQNYITGGFPISDNTFCLPVICKDKIETQYRCVNEGGQISGDNLLDIYRNSQCDVTGPNANCVANYCKKTIDCNDAANATLLECAIAFNEPTINNIDPFESWFYRPKPLTKSIYPNTGLLHQMDPTLCYHKNDLDNPPGWSGLGEHWIIDWGALGSWDLGWYVDYLRFDTASPPACGVHKDGSRGTGLGYLCGAREVATELPSDHTAYFRGYAVTDFTGPYPRHKVTLCLRFKNAMTLNACGDRECGVSAIFNGFTGQTCGGDVCRDVYVSEQNETECMMKNGNQMNSECEAKVDTYIRLRAVKYNNRICAFLDTRGLMAYSNIFFNGSETLSDGKTCVNSAGVNGNCNGFDSNSERSRADMWRTMQKIHYVDNNRPNGPRGYLDYNGKLYPEQECPKVTLRISPPDLYNLGNINNSSKLFTPPLSIRAAMVMRGGSDAIAYPGESYGRTDFHYPEIRVQFGLDTYKMSLGLGYNGSEDGVASENYAASPSNFTATTTFNSRVYTAELFVRKEYAAEGETPLFCLYRRNQDQNGLFLEPLKIGCVQRNRPDIDNAVARNFNPNLPPRMTVVYPKAGNQYNNAKLALKYLSGFGANNINNWCNGDDVCSAEILMQNDNYRAPTCYQETENYRLCVQREECTALNIECVKNEIDFRNAQLDGRFTNEFEEIRRNCNETILPNCNRKKGIASSSGASIYNTNPTSQSVDANAYGWFNELCVVSGYGARLKNIVAHTTATGVKGKCFIDPNSPFLRDSDPNTNCDNGGFAPNCLCIEAPDGYIEDAGQVIRKQTAREAGLCIDMPIPQLCPATNSGHADFSPALLGITDLYGQCSGYWTNATNTMGARLLPTMSCLNVNGSATWESPTRNPCVRYSCPAVLTAGPNSIGIYQGGYGASETAENIGRSNGFATWNSYTKTNDNLEQASAIKCIDGFKKLGSAPIYSGAAIIGYSGGVTPVRNCDQYGVWQVPDSTKICQRIQCSAVNPPMPTSVSDYAAWGAWYDSGGATFGPANASRSSLRIQAESVSVGTCNNSLGFFQSPGGLQPTRECDHLGNWKPVQNPCVTSCTAITNDTEAASLNNGFAKWNAVTGAMSMNGIPGNFAGCVAGYVANPYPPAFDIDGNPLSPAVANDLTRPAEVPKRLCKPGVTALGVSSSVWANVVGGCINKCPGADMDDRIGVGKTTHPKSTGDVTVSWPSTDFGRYAYVTNWTGQETDFNASYFLQGGRTNGYYLLKRYCNANGQWSNPETMCAANDGQIGNAKYFVTNVLPGYKNSIPAASTTEKVTGACIPGFWKSDNNTGVLPQRQCVYAAGNQYIDKVYLDFVTGTADCGETTCPTYSYRGSRTQISTLSRQRVNAQLQGTCINDNTIRTSLGAGLVPPTVVCQSDGTWSAVQNETNCKVGCDFSPWPWGWLSVDVGGCGGGSDGFYYLSEHTLQHGQVLSFVGSDGCGGWSKFLYYGERCNDGVPSYNWKWWGDGQGPSFTTGSYNYATNAFDGPAITIYSSWKAPTTSTSPGGYLSSTYIDKYGVTKPLFPTGSCGNGTIQGVCYGVW